MTPMASLRERSRRSSNTKNEAQSKSRVLNLRMTSWPVLTSITRSNPDAPLQHPTSLMNIAVAMPTQGHQVFIGVQLGVLAATHASRHHVMAVKSPVRATDFARV